MCEQHSLVDLLRNQIEDLFASGMQADTVISALVGKDYEVVDSIFGIGIGFQSDGTQVVCYHPQLKTADP